MPVRLATTVNKISSLHNSIDASLLSDLHQYMKSNGASDSHQNNCLKTMLAFAAFIGPNKSFYDIARKEQVTAFLDTKIKSSVEDPDRKWITTWNDYLGDIKYFFRWLINKKMKEIDDSKNEDEISPVNWETPAFVQIMKKKTKRLSPYSNTEIWDLDELLTIVKYEPSLRNKAALTLFWDLNGRNHEITTLRIGNIRLRERYGEGEIPHNTKTGGGPILLTCSFPYVRDWLNKHPFKNTPEAKLICNLHTGAPVKPEAMWTMMKQLQKRIVRMLKNDSIINSKEKERLDYLLMSKKWNPYCLRHSSISSDSDFLPEYALKKKVRWSMNSKQGSRYIKGRLSKDLKMQILTHNGIMTEESTMQRKPSVLNCYRCSLVNAVESKFCSRCSYPLYPDAYDEIKANEDLKLRNMHEQYERDLKSVREEMNQQFGQIMSIIRQNPKLSQIKPEALLRNSL